MTARERLVDTLNALAVALAFAVVLGTTLLGGGETFSTRPTAAAARPG